MERYDIAVIPGDGIGMSSAACMAEDRFEPAMAINQQLTMRFAGAYTAGTLNDIAEGRMDVVQVISRIVGRLGVAATFEALTKPDSDVKIVFESGRA
jgi:threonine dehydrogenase-like Zn-dependent dehydrogenase